jgi:hypothetical protein
LTSGPSFFSGQTLDVDDLAQEQTYVRGRRWNRVGRLVVLGGCLIVIALLAGFAILIARDSWRRTAPATQRG